MARLTMLDLINTLRGMTEAGSADYTLKAVTYWTDDELQRVLDRHREDVYNSPLAPVPTYINGTVQYLNYYSQYQNFETGTSGTSVFYIQSAAGSSIGTASYTADFANGRVTFGTDTTGSSYYVYGRSYDINRAAADIWRMKAAHAAQQYDFSTDNHTLHRSQMMEMCLKMANLYAGMAGPTTMQINRGDYEES